MSGETDEHQSSLTPDLVMKFAERQIDDLKDLLDERYATQNKAMETAFAAADKAVEAALLSAEKAVTKAEGAAEKRFECVPSSTLVQTPSGLAVIGSLKPGDLLADLVGYTSVVSNYPGEMDLLDVVTTAGVIRCTYRHPWLARMTGGEYQWVQAQHLGAGWTLWRSDGGQEMHPRVRVQAASERPDRTDREDQGATASGETRHVQISGIGRQGAGNDGGERDVYQGRERRIPRGALALEENAGPSVGAPVRVREGGTRVGIRPFGRPSEVVARDGVLYGPEPIPAHVHWLSHGDGQGSEAAVIEVQPGGRGEIARLETASHTYLVDRFGAHNSVNEFRAQLSDQAATFLSRTEAEARFTALTEKLDVLVVANSDRFSAVDKRLDFNQGKSNGANALWAYIGSGISLIVAVISVVIVLTR